MATDQTILIRGRLINAAGSAVASAVVKATRLGNNYAIANALTDSTQYSTDYFEATTNSSGVFTITVTHALATTCPLTYRLDFPDKRYALLPIGVNDGSRLFNVGTILTDNTAGSLKEINITALVQKNILEAGSTKRVAVPSANAAYVFASDNVVGDFHSTVVELVSLPVTVANTSAISFGSSQLLDFPEGRIYVMSSYLREEITFGLTNAGNVTPIASTHGGDIAIGTTATSDSTLGGTDVDLIPSTSIDPISDGSGLAHLAAAAAFDGTSTAKDAYINIIIDDSDVADLASDILDVSGVWVINWFYQGD